MCGISCVVAIDERKRCANQKDRNHLTERLEKSFEPIRHRGPDSSGTWISEDGRVGLGHVRLEINDLSSTGCQPLHSTDGTVHTVVNGEIYDYPRLRAEMEKAIDYKFQGTSDCELVLALYKHYGLSFLSHIRGEFSIVLFDAERELFVAIRDRYGVKPLFWTIQDGELFVAAETKAFLPLGWQPEWDIKSIVGGDALISNCTIFKNVQKVRPGHMLITRCYGTVNEQQYWQTDYPDKHGKETRTEEEMILGLRERLLDAVRERLRADVKVGVSLSGGIDSSVVAGMVNHLIREGNQIGSEAENERLSCFSIAFDEGTGFDESLIANRTADHLNVKFYKKHMNEEQLAGHFENATWINEQVNYDLNYIGVYALSQLFREQGFKVNINGQGSDEILGGYNIFLPDFLLEPDTTFEADSLSDSERKAEFEKAMSTLQKLYADRLNPNSQSVARRQLNRITSPEALEYIYARLPIKKSFLPHNNSIDVELTFVEHLPVTVLDKIQKKWHPLHAAQYVFVTSHLQNLILSHLGDRGEMAHSIEGRTPFLDHHVTEYVNGLPPSVKIRRDPETGEWIEKWVLREAAKPFITEELYKRKKHPYMAPFTFPKGGPLYNLLKRLVTRENVDKLGWVDTSEVDEYVDRAYKNRDTFSFRLCCQLAQWVVLQQRFGVKTAVAPEQETRELSNGH